MISFCNFYNIVKGLEGDLIVETAIRNPEKFVLKPQREGGGKFVFI